MAFVTSLNGLRCWRRFRTTAYLCCCLFSLYTDAAETSNPSGNATVTGDQVIFAPLPICSNLTISPNDSESFYSEYYMNRANFAYFNLGFADSILVKTGGDTFLPFLWVWTYNRTGGAYPYLQFEYDAGSLSLGLLEFHTLHDIKVKFSPVSGENCSLQLGTPGADLAIGQAFGRMVLDYFPAELIARNYSLFCHVVKIDPLKELSPLYYVKTYFGYWKDPTVYSCCSFNREAQTNKLEITCDEHIVKASDWSVFFYYVAVLCFMYVPFPLLWITELVCTESKEDLNAGLENSDDSETTNEETPLLLVQYGDDSTCSSSSGDEWMYLGLDKPVTILQLIFCVFRCLQLNYPVLWSRLRRFCFFAVLIPLPVYIKICLYFFTTRSYFSTQRRIEAGIPVGFLSVPFAFFQSARNWLPIFGGPVIILGIYLTIGQICVCAPKSLLTFLFSVFERDMGRQNTFLFLPLSYIERFGAVTLRDKDPAPLLSALLKGNLFTLINPQFWKFAVRFAIDRFNRWFNIQNRNILVLSITVLLYVFFCFWEIVFFIIYYGCPIIACFANLLRGALHQFPSGDRKKMFLAPFIVTCLLFNFYACFLIFIRGSHYVISSIDYIYIGVVIYPNIALGFVIAVGSMLVYLCGSSHKLSDSYLELLDAIVKINMRLDKAATVEKDTTVTVRENAIVLGKLDLNEVDRIEIEGMTIVLTKEQRQLLSLTKLGLRSPGHQSKYIRWRRYSPGIPSELFHYVAERVKPLRSAVFMFIVELAAFTVIVTSIVKLIIAFNRVSTFTLPAQVVTTVVLTVIPKLNDFFTSRKEKEIQQQITINKLNSIVNEYYSEKEKEVAERQQRPLRPLV